MLGSGGFSGGASPFELEPLFCCLAGSGGGRSSPDEELTVEATLFCDGEEQTPPSPLRGRLAVDERLSLTASERSGRLAVNCCVSSMTTVGDAISDALALLLTVSDDEEASSEWALEPDWIKERKCH